MSEEQEEIQNQKEIMNQFQTQLKGEFFEPSQSMSQKLKTELNQALNASIIVCLIFRQPSIIENNLSQFEHLLKSIIDETSTEPYFSFIFGSKVQINLYKTTKYVCLRLLQHTDLQIIKCMINQLEMELKFQNFKLPDLSNKCFFEQSFIIIKQSLIISQIETLATMEILHKHMVQGILDSKIFQDGGAQCYAEIPKDYHVIVSIASTLLHLLIMVMWSKTLITKQQLKPYAIKPNKMQIFAAVNGLIALALTFYYKWDSGKGMFIFNPCHVSLVLVIVLLFSQTTPKTRMLHTYWSSWLFGAMLAIFLPHLSGITQFEVYLYFYQHFLIFPLGPALLYRRYGFLKPNFRNQIASFVTVVIYQVAVLTPLSMMTMVNLNFALCHSPADPCFTHIGYHYFTAYMIILNIVSYACRWINFIMVLPLRIILNSKTNISKPSIQTNLDKVQSRDRDPSQKHFD